METDNLEQVQINSLYTVIPKTKQEMEYVCKKLRAFGCPTLAKAYEEEFKTRVV